MILYISTGITLTYLCVADWALSDWVLRSCTVCVSDYQDGEWHEENLALEVKLKREIKKVGQLHFRIMVEKSAILEPFEDNQSSVTGSLVSHQFFLLIRRVHRKTHHPSVFS